MAAVWLTSCGASTAVALGAVTGTTLSLTTSANPVLLLNPVTLQATIVSDAGAPSGSIDFYDGAQLLGSAMVNAAGDGILVASFGTTGTHSLTAVYSGSGSFAGEASAAVPEVVEDFGVSAPVMLDNNTCECHLAVGTSIYLFSLGPLGGPTLPSTIQLAVSGLPAGTTATLAPVAIAAGAGATPVTLTVQRPPGTSRLRLRARQGMYGAALSLMLPLGLIGHRRRAGRFLPVGRLAVWAMVLAGLGGVVGCGGSRATSAAAGSSGSGGANYSLTITATGGLLQHTASVTVAVL